MPDVRAFGEIVRTVKVNYPVPFILACMFAFALSCFTIGAVTTGAFRWLTGGAGLLVSECACAIGCYATFVRRDLLRYT
jgi:hypothetical protein